MASLSYNKEIEIIQAFNSTSRYLDDLLNIDNPYFGGMVGRIYPPELQHLFYDTLSKNKKLTIFFNTFENLSLFSLPMYMFGDCSDFASCPLATLNFINTVLNV